MDEETERLDALTQQAGRWLALSAAPAERHTTAVVAGPYDRVAWRDVYAQSAALRELSAQLLTRHAHAPDLLADVFLCAYQAAPRLRDRTVMAPSHLVHHQVVTALTQSPDFAALRRETAGDAYAAAMAVLAQASALRALLERSREARERTGRADRARQEAEAAAAAVGEALRQAAEEADGQGRCPRRPPPRYAGRPRRLARPRRAPGGRTAPPRRRWRRRSPASGPPPGTRRRPPPRRSGRRPH